MNAADTLAAPTAMDLVANLYRTANAVVRELDRRLGEDYGVTFVQATALIAIDTLARPQPGMVADYLSQQSQTVTGVLDRLERRGLVQRVRDLGDRRAVRLELTGSGYDLTGGMEARLQTHVADLFAELFEAARWRFQRDLDLVRLTVGAR